MEPTASFRRVSLLNAFSQLVGRLVDGLTAGPTDGFIDRFIN